MKAEIVKAVPITSYECNRIVNTSLTNLSIFSNFNEIDEKGEQLLYQLAFNLRLEVTGALNRILQKHGLEIKKGSIKPKYKKIYLGNEIETTLELTNSLKIIINIQEDFLKQVKDLIIKFDNGSRSYTKRYTECNNHIELIDLRVTLAHDFALVADSFGWE